jgi:cyclopropane fatty-acyl-phospholipid synthase-like methyltransferase
MTIKSKLLQQFARPHGPLGHLAGMIMANRPSNRSRNLWTVDLLELQPNHRVLEIGCGPGLALEGCLEKVTSGRVIGVDRSSVMVAQSAKRNAAALADQRLMLMIGSENSLEELSCPFDRIYAVNVAMFFSDPQATIQSLASKLMPDGKLAITHMPRNKGATSADTERVGDRLAGYFDDCGLRSVTKHVLALEPVPAVCVTGCI